MQITRRTAKSQLDTKGEYSPLLERILQHRGVSDVDQLSVQAKDLLHYKDLSQIQKAADIIADAIATQQKIVVVGDFDADGATSSALCVLALREMGCRKVDYVVPNRFDFGYGLTSPVVDLVAQQGGELIITVDNGVSSIDGVAHAKRLGINVVVTDHHLAGEHLPNADAIVNPNVNACDFPSKHLAGVGVAFYTMSAVKNTLVTRGYFSENYIVAPNMANYLDLVAIGTVADLVSLDKNNRILVHQGIQRIRNGKTRAGVLALLKTVNKPYQRCSTNDIAFYIGPRLNAAGRLDDISCGIECLLTQDVVSADNYAAQLHQLNQSRKEIEQSMREDADKMTAKLSVEEGELPDALVLYHQDFHQGVVGILAGRLKEAHYRPSIVFANDGEGVLKGSARSIEGLHMRDLLARVDTVAPKLLLKFGGHAMAAGLSIKQQDLDKFTHLVCEQTANYAQQLPKQATVYSDGELSAAELSLETAQQLKYVLPWGQSFEEPIFDGVFELVNQRIVGQKHLKLTLKKDRSFIDAIAFNVDLSVWPNDQITKVKVAYRLDVNEYQGRVSPQLLVLSIEPATAEAER